MNITKLLVPVGLLGTLLLPMAASADSISDRFQDQHQRIQQGVRSRELTRREQYRLDLRESRIRHQEYRDRLSGGRFTLAERRHIQHDLNRTSRAIYQDKHNDQVR